MSLAMIPSGSNPHYYYSVNTEEKKASHNKGLKMADSQAKKVGGHMPGSLLATALVGGVGVSALLVGKNTQKNAILRKLNDLAAQALKMFRGNTAKANMVQTTALAGTVIGAGAITKAMQPPVLPVTVHAPSAEPMEKTLPVLLAKANSTGSEVWNTAVKPSLKWSAGTATSHFKNSYNSVDKLFNSFLSLVTGAPQKGVEEFGKNVGNKGFEKLFPKPPAPPAP